jgi:CRISPR/Cas system CMR subunit Cmr4 (Cas7 group RAMP superfamily)
MRLSPGDQWLRLEAVGPANLGSDHGSAPVDRPTVRDALLDLPYVPDSVLKGVLAGRLGDIDEERPGRSATRERWFGSPDRPGAEGERQWGRPGSAVFGNAELVAFPLALRTGGQASIVPAPSFARLVYLDGGDATVLGLLARIDQAERAVVGWPGPVDLDSSSAPDWLQERSVEIRWPALASHLDRFLGRAADAGSPIVVASGALARRLWAEAAELRSLTALNAGTKTVTAGTLRTVELIPSGTIFAALVSWLEPDDGPELPEQIQVGAWEAQGFGFMTVGAVAPAASRENRLPPPGGAPEYPAPDEAAVMAAMHAAVGEIRPADRPELAAALRAAIASFGPRAQFSGLEAAVAFSLAKAKPAAAEPKVEAQAHRWLLRTVLGLAAEAPDAQAPSAALLSWVDTLPFTPGRLPARKAEILARWGWLRRFAEVGLAPPAPSKEEP